MPNSVNMFSWRLTSDCQARTKNGQVPHSTTGVASANSTPASTRAPSHACTGMPGSMSDMEIRNTSAAGPTVQTKRRFIATPSVFGTSSAVATRRSNAMPLIGRTPGTSRTICACMGQTYCGAESVDMGLIAYPDRPRARRRLRRCSLESQAVARRPSARFLARYFVDRNPRPCNHHFGGASAQCACRRFAGLCAATPDTGGTAPWQ